MHRFDELLWSKMVDGGHPRLPGLVSESFNGARDDQLTNTVLLGTHDEIFSRLRTRGGERVAEALLSPAVGVLKVREGDALYTISVWPGGTGTSWLAGVPPFTDERWRRAERWIASLEPLFAKVFLDEDDFAGIGETLSEAGRVEVSRMTARVLADGSSYTRGWPEDRVFLRPTYDQALAEVSDFAAVRTLTLHVEDRLSLHLRRTAGATYYSGDFDLFMEAVMAKLVAAADERRSLLEGRARSAEVDPTSAIAVELSRPAFSSEMLHELVSHISEQRGLGVAILHRNPYLHVAVTDYLDGSNYDVFVTSDSELVIFPGYRATLGSLARTADSIGERFAAVAVTEVPSAQPPTRDELLTSG